MAEREPIPREIGGYRIQRIIGSGGMATVYAAMQRQPKRLVALKVLKTGSDSKTALHRFRREIEILGRLHHPYIAQVYDAGTHEDPNTPGKTFPFYVMEYVSQAKNILEFIAAKQLDVRQRLKLFFKVCAAVECGHRNKIIHRDLKPGNILIDTNGDPKVIDFGVAQATEIKLTDETIETDESKLVGTIHYMSPEQLAKGPRDLDARCDVYALGTLLYKMLTGQLPHELKGLSVYDAIRIKREEAIRPPSALNREVKGDLESIILKALQKEPAHRYRNAGELGRDVLRYLEGKTISSRRKRIISRTPIAISGVFALAIIGVGVLMFLQRDRAESDLPSAQPSPPVLVTNEKKSDSQRMITSPLTLREHTSAITSLLFSSNGSQLISASQDHTAVIWNLDSTHKRKVIREFDGPVHFLGSDGHAEKVVIAARERSYGFPIVADAEFGKVIKTIRVGCDTIRAFVMSHNADTVAFSCDDFTLRVRSVSLNRETTLRSTTGGVTCAAFDSTGEFIAAGSEKGTVYVWNVSSFTEPFLVKRFDNLKDEVLAIGFVTRSDKSLLVSISTDGFGQIANVASDEHELETFRAHGSPLVGASLDASGRFLACATTNTISVVDVLESPPKRLDTELTSDKTIYALAINSAGQVCALGYSNGDIEVRPFEFSTRADTPSP